MHHIGPKRAALVLFLITVAFYWKLVLTNQYSWMESPDIAHQVLPWFQFQAGEIQAGRLPLWAPFEWGGQPLVGQAQPGAAYPPNWLMFLMPLKRGWLRVGVLHWYYVLIHFFAAWFMYMLCRDRKAGVLGSLTGAMIFSFGGYVGNIDWPQMVNGAIWAPLIFMFHLRAVEGKNAWNSAALSGFFLGIAWLSGHHQIPIFVSLAVGISWLYFTWRQWSNFKYLLLFSVIVALMAGLQLVPAMEYGRLAKRWVGLAEPVDWKQVVPYFIHQQYGFQPLSILGIIIPGLNFNTSSFVGLAALLMAAAAWRKHTYFAALAGAGLVYSLSQFGGVEGLFYSLVPMVEKARSPSMAVVIFSLGLAPLAALGISDLPRLATPLWRWLVAGGAAVVLLFYAGWAVTHGVSAVPDQRPIMTALLMLVMAASRFSPRAMAVVCFLELSLMAPYYWPNRYDPAPTPYLKNMALHQEVVDYLRQQPQPVRIMLDDAVAKHNLGDWMGVDVYGGYLASLTANILDAGLHDPYVRRLVGVTHWVGKAPLDPKQTAVFQGAHGLNVYPMEGGLPRVWTVHQTFRATTAADRGRLLRDSSFDLSQGAVMDRELPLETCRGDRTALLRQYSGEVVIAADIKCRGLLVLGDVAYPGWKARVDGQAQEVLTVNGIVRGVVLERGFHHVELRYSPNSVLVGGIMTFAGALLTVGTLIMGRRRLARDRQAAVLDAPRP
jgi:hypothetical protein